MKKENVLNFKIPTMRTIKETALIIGLAETYIRGLVINNKIVHVKSGKKYLINLEKFVEYLNTSKGESEINNKFGIKAIN